MERKRIIIETGDDIANREEYQVLKTKLEAIEKKMTAPWVLPLTLAVFGALLTGINFYFQQEYNNSVLYHNKAREKVAELRATVAVEFYGSGIRALDSLDTSLQSYCDIGPNANDEVIIQSNLVRLNAMARQQYYLDTAAANRIRTYTQFVAVNVFKLKPMPAQEAMEKLYERSSGLYKLANAGLNDGLERITK